MTTRKEAFWMARDLSECSACRKCEIASSLARENRVWPEASRIGVFMLVPGFKFPHLYAQCADYLREKAYLAEALSVSKRTGPVMVKREKCIACGKCIGACSGRIPLMHPAEKKLAR